MNKKLSILTLLLLASLFGCAKKMIMPIEHVALEAYIIVTGKIISITKNSYQFKVVEYVKGTGDSIITVQKFKEWICDTRYASVDTGQTLFLFLENINNKFEIINGSTGEIPILADSVTLQYEENHRHKGGDFTPYTLSFLEFKNGIKRFVPCFQIPKDGYFRQVQILQKCSMQKLKEFIGTNNFTKWLYTKLKSNYKIVKV